MVSVASAQEGATAGRDAVNPSGAHDSTEGKTGKTATGWFGSVRRRDKLGVRRSKSKQMVGQSGRRRQAGMMKCY